MTNTNTVNAVKNIFSNDEIHKEEKGFLEELIEAIPLVVDSEDVGDTIEYYDEFGCVLFCVDIVDANNYLFRFYENEYLISEDALQKIKSILVSPVTTSAD